LALFANSFVAAESGLSLLRQEEGLMLRSEEAMSDTTPPYKDLTQHLPEPQLVPLPHYRRYPEPDMLARAEGFYAEMNRRRTTRNFSNEPVPRRLIELAMLTAGTAPSGAHRQPWRFVAIDDPAIKAKLRAAAEQEEYKTYSERMTSEWREALHPLGTDHLKPHMTDAPWLVVLFAEKYGLNADGSHRKNYYVDESVGIAAGLFIAAIQMMGLVTLTHTPNPMGFLRDVLGRSPNEKGVLMLPVGYPAHDAKVPDLKRLPAEAFIQWNVPAATTLPPSRHGSPVSGGDTAKVFLTR
jgi:iodotyrosine deiodinase